MATEEQENLRKFKDIYWQTCDKASWFWGHIAESVLYHPVKWYGYDGKDQPEGSRSTISLATMLGWFDTAITGVSNKVQEVSGKLDGLIEAVKALGEKQGVDPAKLEALIGEAVERAADKHLAEIGTYELRRVEDTPKEGTK